MSFTNYKHSLKKVKESCCNIKYVNKKLHTLYLCYHAIKEGYHLEDIHTQTEDLCLICVKVDGMNLQYVKNQTLKICKEAIKQNIEAKIFVNDEFKQILDI